MAGARALRNKMNDEFLTCQICLNIYVEPVLLDCQHSFCRSCVQQCLPTVSGSLHCPVCRQKTSIPKKLGLATLKKNFFLQSLIDTFTERRNSIASLISNNDVTNTDGSCHGDVTKTVSPSHKKKHKKEKRLCENCEEDKGLAVSRCLDCTDYLCQDCELVHCQTKFTRRHKIVKLRDLITGDYSSEIQARAKVFCSNHPDEICRQICVQCFVSHCHDCLAQKHEGHPTRDLKEFIAEEKSRLEKLLVRSTAEESLYSENLKKVIGDREKEESEKKKAIQEVQKRTKAIIAASKSHEDKIIKGIKSLSRAKKNYLTNKEDNCKLKLAKIQRRYESLKEKSEDVLHCGTPVEFLGLLPCIDELKSALDDKECEINEPDSFKSEWKLCPAVEEMTASLLLLKVKSTLKALVGFVEGRGSNIDLQEFEEVLGTTDLTASSSSSNSDSSIVKNNFDHGYCHMRSLLPNGNNKKEHRTSGSSFTTDDENVGGSFQKMTPVARRRKLHLGLMNPISSPTESPSLNLMRKFPPKSNPPIEDKQSTSQSVKTREETAMNGSNEVVPGGSKVIQWNLRSRSEDRFADDVIQNETTRGRPKSSAPKESVISPVARQRGRKRHRSLPGSANFSTQPPEGSLISLATSRVAALAENPARLGIYLTPDPTSDAAVASLTRAMSGFPDGESGTAGAVRCHGGAGNVLVKSFQLGGRATTFKSAPKLSCLPNGQIVCTDYKAQRLFLFNTDGTLANSFKTKCSGIKSLHPISATATKKGKLLVACGDAVYKFTVNGKFSKKFGNGCFKKCCGIATDPRTGRIIVTDIDKQCASIHESEGGLVRIFKGGGSPADGVFGARNLESGEALKLQTPYFVAVDRSTGNVIVSDWASNDVKVYDQDGNYLTSLRFCSFSHSSHSFSSSPRDELSNPAGVCCDVDGNIFVADHGRNRVAMFSNNWQFLRFVATDKDGLQTPWSLVAISNKRLCVSEYWSRNIKVFPY